MPIPAFDPQTGYLPAGLHFATEAEVEATLGMETPERQKLFGHLHELLVSARHIKRLFIDGSFVTDKEQMAGSPPNDIDCVVWLPSNIDQMIRDADRHAMYIFGLHLTGKLGPLDLYPVTDRSEWDNWCEFFGSDRAGTPKGCVEVAL